jgi:serine/threonine-protein kinase
MSELASSSPSLGRYRILSRLGAGGMGEVYLASGRGPFGVERRVAIKLIRDLHEEQDACLQMFVEEAKLSFLLTHPNVVQTFELGQVDGHYFLVMEYVSGTTLSQLLRYFAERLRQPFPVPFALHIAQEVAKGLEYAHGYVSHEGKALQIVHRDVSPSNVLLSSDGQIKVSDFGLAISALRQIHTESGAIKGKILYMAPEQLRGRGVDRRADLYSLGVMLYEMLSVRSPFGVNRREVTVQTRLEGKTPPVPLAEVAPHLPGGVVALVERCLAEAPEARHPSARELGREIELCLRQAGQSVSNYDFADFIAQAREAAEAEPAAPHPFDRALGLELRRVDEEGGLARFVTTPPSAPAGPSVSAPSSPPLRALPTAPTAVESPVTVREPGASGIAPLPRSRTALLVGLGLLLAAAAAPLLWLGLRRSEGPAAGSASPATATLRVAPATGTAEARVIVDGVARRRSRSAGCPRASRSRSWSRSAGGGCSTKLSSWHRARSSGFAPRCPPRGLAEARDGPGGRGGRGRDYFVSSSLTLPTSARTLPRASLYLMKTFATASISSRAKPRFERRKQAFSASRSRASPAILLTRTL